MQWRAITKILGVLLMLFSLSMLPPIVVSWIYQDHDAMPFTVAFILNLGIGFLLWLPQKKYSADLKARDGFLVVFAFWLVLSLFSAIPFMLSYDPHMNLSHAIFEAIAGITTTGASILETVDHLPPSILYYRQQLQFMGGMGVIILAVAVLPMIGVGGMQLYRAEATGPSKDKLTPRITETAKTLWYIYAGMTLFAALIFWLFGMSFFDAINYSMSTISTGGYAPHDLSGAFYPQASIQVAMIIFMVMGGTNFTLHFIMIRKGNLRYYWQEPEFRCYIIVIFFASLITTMALMASHHDEPIGTTILNGTFQVVSYLTTSGFNTTNILAWPVAIQVLLLFLGAIGGCAGSTSGGIKIVRLMLLHKQGQREVKRLLHPNGIFNIKLGELNVPNHIINATWGFLAGYVLIFIILLLILLSTGLGQVTAFSGLLACISNTGPGLGQVNAYYGHLNPTALWILSFAMLIGRLEVFTILVLFSRAFWKT